MAAEWLKDAVFYEIYPQSFKDSNGDGVKDILQKGQNAYTGTTAKMDSTLEKVGFVAELVDALT